jgi:hypothetical protein
MEKPPKATYEEMEIMLQRAVELINNQKRLIDKQGRMLSKIYPRYSRLQTALRKEAFHRKEAIRLFSDRRGQFGEMMQKARDILEDDAQLWARNQSLNMANNDEVKKRAWSKMEKYRKAEQIIMRYADLIGCPMYAKPTEDDEQFREWWLKQGNEPFIGKEEAIEQITAEFGFPTAGAARKWLYEEGVKNLPDNFGSPKTLEPET